MKQAVPQLFRRQSSRSERSVAGALRIFLGKLGRGRVMAGAPVGLGKKNDPMQGFQRPAFLDQRGPSQSNNSGWVGFFPLAPKLFGLPARGCPKMPLPDPVHNGTDGEAILGVCNPVGYANPPVPRCSGNHCLEVIVEGCQNAGDAGCHLFRRRIGISPGQNRRLLESSLPCPSAGIRRGTSYFVIFCVIRCIPNGQRVHTSPVPRRSVAALSLQYDSGHGPALLIPDDGEESGLPDARVLHQLALSGNTREGPELAPAGRQFSQRVGVFVGAGIPARSPETHCPARLEDFSSRRFRVSLLASATAFSSNSAPRSPPCFFSGRKAASAPQTGWW